MKTLKRPNGPKGTKTIAATAWLDELSERVYQHGWVSFKLKVNGRVSQTDLVNWAEANGFILGRTNSGETIVVLNRETDQQAADRATMEAAIEREIVRKSLVADYLNAKADQVQKMGVVRFTVPEEVHEVDLINWATATGFVLHRSGEDVVAGLERNAA